MRFLLTLAASAALVWLLLVHPLEGRNVVSHLTEIWRLPEVQHKAALVRAELGALGARLGGARPDPQAAGDSDRLDAGDRQGLDGLIRRAAAAPSARQR